MSQLTAPTTPRKLSLSLESHDYVLPLGKKQKEKKSRHIPDYIHQESDEVMKALKSCWQGESIDDVLRYLWFTVELAKGGKPEFELVREHLEVNNYIQQPELQGLIDKCAANDTWKDLREHGLNFLDSLKDAATERPWGVEYQGLASEALKKTILSYEESRFKNCYAQAIPIVQSSGTGKSRMIDQLAKELIVIPLNLRPPNQQGFPPSDEKVLKYLCLPGEEPWRCFSFLPAVFICTKEILEKIDDEILKVSGHDSYLGSSLAAKFRFLMTAGLSYQSQGSFRIEFYRKVLDMALHHAVNSKNYSNLEDLLLNSAKALTDYAKHKGYKTVVFALDEVQGLFTPLERAKEHNVFHCIRRALHSISTVKSLVSLFLSTVVEDIIPPDRPDPSARLMKPDPRILPPFTDIGFDQLAIEQVKKDEHYLVDMVTDEWMCQFGRPLFGTRYNEGGHDERSNIVAFAAMKLMGGTNVNLEKSKAAQIAILATRLSLGFDRTTLASRTLQVEQVANHMRFCLAIEDDNATLTTIAASEPILAEGAFHIVRQLGLDQAELLSDVMSDPSLDKGDHGEMVALLLFILARDTVVNDKGSRNIKLTDFLDALLQSDGQNTQTTKLADAEDVRYASATHCSNILEGNPMFLHKSNENVSLQRCFEHSEVHFNHFTRIEHSSAMNRNLLHGLIARGAAILCPANQPGVDVVIPFVFDARKPVGPDNVSVIFCQVQNSSKFTTKVVGDLFSRQMDPFELGVFNPPDEQVPIPFIRMVMALGSPEPGLAILSLPQRNLPQKSMLADNYTAYDIWCARACSSTFRVISTEQDTAYETLLVHLRVAGASSLEGWDSENEGDSSEDQEFDESRSWW